eukprot:scaffold320417_cov14-Tisochrysis_lutea.AAC.1
MAPPQRASSSGFPAAQPLQAPCPSPHAVAGLCRPTGGVARAALVTAARHRQRRERCGVQVARCAAQQHTAGSAGSGVGAALELGRRALQARQ